MKRHIKKMKISYRFTLSVVIAITLIFLLTTVYEYHSEVRELKDYLSFKLEYTAHMMSSSLADPVWDYDYDGIEALGDSLFQDPEIAFLIVLDNVSGELYNHEMKGKSYDPACLRVMNYPITYDDEKVGSISIGVTDYFGLQKIRDGLLFRIMELIVVVITLTVVIFFISYQITKPLLILAQDVKALAEGKERIRLEDYSDDEIGLLARNFNDMGDVIEHTSNELQVINESLEDKVAVRTDELMIKNEELNRTLKTLKDTQSQLIRSSKLKLTTRLVAGVAHEINTPLGLAITITTFIEDKINQIKELSGLDNLSEEDLDKLTDDVQSSLQSLEMNLKRVTKLMEHFKQLMLENQSQVPVVFDLKEHLVKTCNSMMMDLLPNKIDLNLQCQETLVIKSYPTAYTQILYQLVDNAITHGFKELNEGKIIITCEEKEEHIILTVADNGVGMPPEIAENAFNPFYKGDTKMNGSGLGLSIVENIVNVHLGGNIRCTSNVQKGTTYELQLPLV